MAGQGVIPISHNITEQWAFLGFQAHFTYWLSGSRNPAKVTIDPIISLCGLNIASPFIQRKAAQHSPLVVSITGQLLLLLILLLVGKCKTADWNLN